MLLFGGDDSTGLMTAPVPAPGTAPTRAVSAGTSQLPAVGGAAAAGLGAERDWTDQDLDSDEPEETPRGQQKKKRSPWTWPLVGLILLILFAVAGAILFPMLTPTGGTESSSSASSATTKAAPKTTSATPTEEETEEPTETATPETNQLAANAFLGRPFSEVRAELENMGYQVVPNPVESGEAENTVIDIAPTGAVVVGEAITVTYSTGPGTVTIPNGLAGQSEQRVREALIGLNLVPQKSGEQPSDEEAGTVLSLSPDGGDVPVGSTVSYVVSSGPEEEETPAPPTETGSPDAKGLPTSAPDTRGGKP
jgi:serine/threonine-protein kinase